MQNALSIINNFKNRTKLYKIADPHFEKEYNLNYIFYHVFVGDYAKNVNNFILDFDKKPNTDDIQRLVYLKSDERNVTIG